MPWAPRDLSMLSAALRSYVDARAGALLAARKNLGINELDARVLLYILDHPGARPVEVKNRFGLTSAGTTVLTDRLVERGAVRRNPDPDDRRSVRLEATIDVAADPWSALTRFDDDFEAAVLGLEPDEAEQSATLLSRLMALVGDRR